MLPIAPLCKVDLHFVRNVDGEKRFSMGSSRRSGLLPCDIFKSNGSRGLHSESGHAVTAKLLGLGLKHSGAGQRVRQRPRLVMARVIKRARQTHA